VFAKSEVFTAAHFHVEFSIVTLPVVIGYQRFRDTASIFWVWQDGPLKCWHPATKLHSITTQNILICTILI